MADFPVCLKKKDGGFGVSGLRWCCFMPFIFFRHQSIFERFFMLFSFLEVNPLESINGRVLCQDFTTLQKLQKI